MRSSTLLPTRLYLPSPCPCMVRQASETLSMDNGNVRVLSFAESFTFRIWLHWGPNTRQDVDENFALRCVCRVAFRLCSVTASGDYRRPAATCSSASATPPRGLRFPSKSFLQVHRKDFSGPSVNAERRHLGAGPTRKALPGVTRTRSGIQNGDILNVPEQSHSHRLPRQRHRSSHRQQSLLYHVLACYKVVVQGQEQQPVHIAH
jgi:hypothetical protein